MKKTKFVNEGGIQGAGTGHVDLNSKDWKAFLGTIQQHSQNRSKEERTDTKLRDLRFRMGCYLRNETSSLPNDIPSLLSACIEAIEVKQKDFAAYIGIKPSNLSAMLKGRRSISPDFALKLEQIFGIPATLWLSVQSKNELESLQRNRYTFTPMLSLKDLLTQAGKVKSLPTDKSKKHEQTRKTASR